MIESQYFLEEKNTNLIQAGITLESDLEESF